jgi:hypothetical protein
LFFLWQGIGGAVNRSEDKYRNLGQPAKNDQMQAQKKAELAAKYPPGSVILSRDKRTKYQVQADGSWKKMAEGQYSGEFEEVNGGA